MKVLGLFCLSYKTYYKKCHNFYHYLHVMNITQDLLFLNIHNPFTNERISVYLDKHSRKSLDTKDYFVKQIIHLSKGVVIVASETR